MIEILPALLWSIFIAAYTYESSWWRNEFGWNTVLVSLSIVTVLLFSSVSHPFLLIIFSVLGLHRLRLLYRVQHDSRKAEDYGTLSGGNLEADYSEQGPQANGGPQSRESTRRRERG